MTIKEVIAGNWFADRSQPYYVFRVNGTTGSLRIYTTTGRMVNALSKLVRTDTAITAKSNIFGHTPIEITFYLSRIRPLTVEELTKLTKRL